jgi:hypothetical protein
VVLQEKERTEERKREREREGGNKTNLSRQRKQISERLSEIKWRARGKRKEKKSTRAYSFHSFNNVLS